MEKMNKTGRTPLLRAKYLEKVLDVGEIYLKLEGANPYGHKFDRVGELLVKDAVAGGYRELMIDGSRTFIRSLIQCAEQEGLGVFVPLYKGQSWKSKLVEGAGLLDFRDVRTEDRENFIYDYCERRGYYNCVNGYSNRQLSVTALEEIGEEICRKIDSVTSVFAQLSYGYTVSSLHSAFFRTWARGGMDRYPRIYSCTIPKGNRIFEDYKVRNQIQDIDEYGIHVNRYTRDLFIENTQLLEDALKAIRDTEGEIITVDEKFLKEAASMLRINEFIVLSTEEAYSFAGFYKLAKEGKLEKGRHVIVLNNGRSDVTVKKLEDEESLSKEKLLGYVRTFLMQYSDSVAETSDAIDNAMEAGAVFAAYIDGNIEGVAIVVDMGFENFIPRYHLAYIGTRTGRKGRGIAGALIEEVIQFSQGSLSLHVDLDNSKAKRLYEKFGFVHTYNRMIYKG